ncbi:MAG: hypothetical protein KatS3mg087_1369 [Patescibacteria group bacterium]|nr:MAG: hypothetical protein KatS3mg087_1369 [Patescibacteria group bacterium]
MPQSANLTLCDKKGIDFGLYLNLNNDCTTPVWSFHKGVTGDLEVSETEDESELTVRDPAQVVRQYVSSRIDVEITGQQVVDQLYEGCAFINSARAGGTPVDVAVLSGPITEVGAMGWRGRFRNFDRSMSGPEQGSATQNFRLKPAACQTDDCKVRPVLISTSGTVGDYNPETFTPTV